MKTFMVIVVLLVAVVGLATMYNNTSAQGPQAQTSAPSRPKPAQLKNAPDATVFGLALGAKFQLPECVRSKKTQFYVETDAVPCFERHLLPSGKLVAWNSPVGNEYVSIVLPLRPQIVSNRKLSAEIIDGNLKSISFDTEEGPTAQDEAFAALKTKYGNPETDYVTSERNLYSDSHAVWYFTDLMVTFDRTIDHGAVDIINETIIRPVRSPRSIGPRL